MVNNKRRTRVKKDGWPHGYELFANEKLQANARVKLNKAKDSTSMAVRDSISNFNSARRFLDKHFRKVYSLVNTFYQLVRRKKYYTKHDINKIWPDKSE